MVGPWFTTSWRLVSQSHRAAALFSPPPHIATSHHRPIPIVPWTPYPARLLCGPFPYLIPCLYPTRPPAALWRGPTGSSSIQGPFRAPSTGRSLPVPALFPRVASSAHSPRLLCGPFPSLIPCLYPTGQPATLWRGPTGSSSIWGPFRAPSTGRSPPAPAPFFCAACHAVLAPWGRRVALATRPYLSRHLIPASRFFLGTPATLCRGPTGSAAFPGPVRVPSTGRPLLAPFCLRGVFPSGPVVGPPSWPLPPPLGLSSLLILFFGAMISFFAVPRLPFFSVPFPRRPLALCRTPS